ATSMVVAASYLGGERRAGPAMRATGRRFLVLLAVFFLTLLLKLAGLVLCLVGALVPMTLFLVTTPAVMVEEVGPIQAMARPVPLVRPRFWPVLAIGIGSGVLAGFLGNILAGPFSIAALAVGYRWGWILAAIGAIVPALITTPFVSILATLVYFDLRIRNEGFDLQMIAAELERGAPTRCPGHPAPPAPRPPAPACPAGLVAALAPLTGVVAPSQGRGELPVPDRDPEQVREVVREVLSRPEFRPPHRSLTERLFDWLLELIGRLLAVLGGSGAGGIVGLVLLALVLVGVGVLAARFSRGLTPSPEVAAAVPAGRRRSAAEWRAEAEAQERDGAWRE